MLTAERYPLSAEIFLEADEPSRHSKNRLVQRGDLMNRCQKLSTKVERKCDCEMDRKTVIIAGDTRPGVGGVEAPTALRRRVMESSGEARGAQTQVNQSFLVRCNPRSASFRWTTDTSRSLSPDRGGTMSPMGRRAGRRQRSRDRIVDTSHIFLLPSARALPAGAPLTPPVCMSAREFAG